MAACDDKLKETRASLHLSIRGDIFKSANNCGLPIIEESDSSYPGISLQKGKIGHLMTLSLCSYAIFLVSYILLVTVSSEQTEAGAFV